MCLDDRLIHDQWWPLCVMSTATYFYCVAIVPKFAKLPHSGKLSKEKTFVNFAILWISQFCGYS